MRWGMPLDRAVEPTFLSFAVPPPLSMDDGASVNRCPQSLQRVDRPSESSDTLYTLPHDGLGQLTWTGIGNSA